MSTESDWQRRRQQEWDERHRQWAREQREREEREGTDYWKTTQPKTQSFFDWSESERAAEAALRAEDLRKTAEEVRRGREEMNRMLEDHVAQMGGSGSIPPCLATLGLDRADRQGMLGHPDDPEPVGFARADQTLGTAWSWSWRSRPQSPNVT
jgi:hypothetical protein